MKTRKIRKIRITGKKKSLKGVGKYAEYGSNVTNKNFSVFVLNSHQFLFLCTLSLIVFIAHAPSMQSPYPSEEQKKKMSSQTGLTILQVNNWLVYTQLTDKPASSKGFFLS